MLLSKVLESVLNGHDSLPKLLHPALDVLAELLTELWWLLSVGLLLQHGRHHREELDQLSVVAQGEPQVLKLVLVSFKNHQLAFLRSSEHQIDVEVEDVVL